MHKQLCFFLCCAILLLSGNVRAQQVKVVKLPELLQLLQSDKDTLYVVNFWATWCKPCVQELPYFEKAQERYAGQPLQVVLVSLDFVQDLKQRVEPFIQKRNLKSRLLLLDEPDYNSWIDQVEPAWSGAIPATLVFNNKRRKRQFFEKTFTEEQLHELISQHLK